MDLSKEIVFKDGITLDNGLEDLTDDLFEAVERIRQCGLNFGLTLDEFEIFSDLILFVWRGSKKKMLDFYTYYSENLTTESPEMRKVAQTIILNK